MFSQESQKWFTRYGKSISLLNSSGDPKFEHLKTYLNKSQQPLLTGIIIRVSHAGIIGTLAGLRRPYSPPHPALCGIGGALAHDIIFFFSLYFLLYFTGFVNFYYFWQVGGRTKFRRTHLVDHKLSSFYFVNSK